MIIFDVKISDKTNTIKLRGNVIWLEGGDNKVEVDAPVAIEQGEVLDKWEANKTKLNVSIEPICLDIMNRERKCPDTIEEYNSQEGTATMTWVYNPNGSSKIIFTFETES